MERALVKATNEIRMASNNGLLSGPVLLDRAAFHTLQYIILLHRLEHFVGINRKAVSWFKSYFFARFHCVHFNNKSCSSSRATCGVKQGSVLG